MDRLRAVASLTDWKFTLALLLLTAAAGAAAIWDSPRPAAPQTEAGQRIEIDKMWLRSQDRRKILEMEAEAAREGRPLRR